MQEEEKKKSGNFFKNLKNRYRLVILNDSNFEERFSFKLTKLNLYTGISSILLILIFVIISVIVFTPVKQYIPGYGDLGMRAQLIDLNIKTDSLEMVVAQREAWIDNIKYILRGEIETEFPDTSEESLAADFYYDTIRLDKISPEEALLRQAVEQEMQTSIFYEGTNQPGSFSYLEKNFMTPMRGLVTAEFDPGKGHYGIDVVAESNSPVKAIYDGVVVFAEWTLETGYVIAVQHSDNLLSFYKHNSVLLKKVGSFVKTGDVIAVFGDSGEYSSGPHLHFELWQNGVAVNPRDYIIF
ncbi:MAG: M23 family metallopeptidase [Chitinophagaceae bacterium]|nr:MAG: M23 family metallopeptidase [Chitinophagaceae bacterium]